MSNLRLNTIEDYSEGSVINVVDIVKFVRIARGTTSIDYQGDGVDYTSQIQNAIDNYQKVILGPGLYNLSSTIRLREGTQLVGAGESNTELFFEGNSVSWLFINGVQGDSSYVTGSGYNGDGGILVQDLSIDLNGQNAINTRAAFIFGRSENNTLIRITMKNGKNSHRIECNSQRRFRCYDCTFKDTIDTGSGSYHEEINIDYNNSAGFPGYGNWDNTPCDDCEFVGCRFVNVQGGVSSHSNPTEGNHRNIKILNCYFENVTRQAVRAQGFDDSIVDNNLIINCGREAIYVEGDNNRITEGRIKGASGQTAGTYSAVRIEGDRNHVDIPSIETDTGYTYPYAIAIASGSRNSIYPRFSEPGSTNLILDNGSLTNKNGLVKLFDGNSGTSMGATIPLSDSLLRYKSLLITSGSVSGGAFRTERCHPFDSLGFRPSVDILSVSSFNGGIALNIDSLTQLSVQSASDSVRHVYGIT